ncbi:hypothetical protein GW17_00057522, partial [Ensete ventricosum]
GLAVGRRGRRGDGGRGLRGYAEEENRVMAAGVAVRCNLRSHGGEEEGATGSGKGCRRGGGLLAAVGVGKPIAGISYIPVFKIRMEKMKKVKRPPL